MKSGVRWLGMVSRGQEKLRSSDEWGPLTTGGYTSQTGAVHPLKCLHTFLLA